MNKKRTFVTLAIIGAISLCLTVLFKFSQAPEQPYLTVIGPVGIKGGIEGQAAEIIELLKDDLTIKYKPSNIESTSKEIGQMLRKQNSPMGKVIVYADFLGIGGYSFKEPIKGLKNSGDIRIAYSMFDSSLIPSEWVVTLNHYFDAVAVPDKFLVGSYRNSGVTIPIFVLPLGLHLEQWLEAPLKKSKQSPMVFANFSTILPRKNQIRLIRAFYQAFGNSKDVVLKLNNRNGDLQYIQAVRNEIHSLGVTNIVFTEMEMGKELYSKIFQNIDCYVSLSLGEGFSVLPREAMALGIPVIITNNTEQSTICESHLGRAVASRNLIPAFYPAFNNHYGTFYDCTTEDAAQALKDVYNNYDYYLQQGPDARAWACQGTYSQLKPLYLGLIKPEKIVLGTINKITPDCLFTDSEELCEKFNRLAEVPFEDRR